MQKSFFFRTCGGLIVSCQALADEPLHSPAIMARMALAAAQGGACGIRANGVEDILAIRAAVDLPMIGIIKKEYPDSEVYITPTMEQVDALAATDVEVIAIDATARARPGGVMLAPFFAAVRAKYPNRLFMADCATIEEALAAQEMGFDLVGSTLCGYTSYTKNTSLPDYGLIETMAKHLHIPVIAEGGILLPEQFLRILDIEGVHCAVIGTAITRPREITRRFVQIAHRVGHTSAQSKIMVFDIGGTTLKYGLFDHSLHPVFLKEQPTNADKGVAHILDTVCSLAQSHGPLDGIGISTSGQVSPADGSILFATHAIPGYTGIPLKQLVAQRTGVPVCVANDANCAALGEAVFGAGCGISDFLCLTYGTGVGGAIVLNHTVMTGAGGVAGEFGHIVTHKDGELCSCGRRGCYERYASTRALEARVAAVLSEPITGPEIFARRKEPRIAQALDAWMDDILCGLVSLVYIFNPKSIILAGGVMRQSFLFSEIDHRLRQALMPSFGSVQLKRAQIGNYSGLYGAYYNAVHYNDTKEQD